MNESEFEISSKQTIPKYESKKHKIFRKFYYIPTPDMRVCLNKIISELRNIPIDEAKYKQYVRPNEFKLFVVRMGIV